MLRTIGVKAARRIFREILTADIITVITNRGRPLAVVVPWRQYGELRIEKKDEVKLNQ